MCHLMLYTSTERLNLNCVYTPFAQLGKISLVAVLNGFIDADVFP